MSYLFTSESVSEGHPDKVSDQISDAILDEMLTRDAEAKVACETFVTTGLVVVGGEVNTSDDKVIDVQSIVRNVIKRIGYTKSNIVLMHIPVRCLMLFMNNLLIFVRVLSDKLKKSKVLVIKG